MVEALFKNNITTKILGVAVKFNKIMVCLPAHNRHSSCFEYATKVLGIDYCGCAADNQGFYTNDGLFLDRKQAFDLAKKENQIINPDNVSGILFSENLW